MAYIALCQGVSKEYPLFFALAEAKSFSTLNGMKRNSSDDSVFYDSLRSPLAGLFSNLPSPENLEPWQEQSQERSCGFHFSAQPRWGHLFFDRVRSLHRDSQAFTASCGLKILLEGSNTFS